MGAVERLPENNPDYPGRSSSHTTEEKGPHFSLRKLLVATSMPIAIVVFFAGWFMGTLFLTMAVVLFFFAVWFVVLAYYDAYKRRKTLLKRRNQEPLHTQKTEPGSKAVGE